MTAPAALDIRMDPYTSALLKTAYTRAIAGHSVYDDLDDLTLTETAVLLHALVNVYAKQDNEEHAKHLLGTFVLEVWGVLEN